MDLRDTVQPIHSWISHWEAPAGDGREVGVSIPSSPTAGLQMRQ